MVAEGLFSISKDIEKYLDKYMDQQISEWNLATIKDVSDIKDRLDRLDIDIKDLEGFSVTGESRLDNLELRLRTLKQR